MGLFFLLPIGIFLGRVADIFEPWPVDEVRRHALLVLWHRPALSGDDCAVGHAWAGRADGLHWAKRCSSRRKAFHVVFSWWIYLWIFVVLAVLCVDVAVFLVAYDRFSQAHEDAEKATARAAVRSGSAFTLSSLGTMSMEVRRVSQAEEGGRSWVTHPGLYASFWGG